MIWADVDTIVALGDIFALLHMAFCVALKLPRDIIRNQFVNRDEPVGKAAFALVVDESLRGNV